MNWLPFPATETKLPDEPAVIEAGETDPMVGTLETTLRFTEFEDLLLDTTKTP
jgi:hypothetical protein